MNTKIKSAVIVCALALAAQADASIFDITFTSNDGTTVGSGWVSGDLAPGAGSDVYEATAGSFEITSPYLGFNPGISYALMLNPNPPNTSTSPSGYFYFDNRVLDGQNPLLSNPGLLFGSGGFEINLFSNGSSEPVPGGTYQLYANTGANLYGDVALAAVPEPATILSGALMLLPFGTKTLRTLRKRLMA